MPFTPAPIAFDADFVFPRLARRRLEAMRTAGMTVLECYRVLEKAGANVVGQVLKGQGTFYELEHYPKGDVYDAETGAQYYYHAHRPESGEHGHFHTFLRAEGMPLGVRPVPYSGTARRPEGEQAICHLVAISMDAHGYPTHLFTTNRWVTDETFYPAADTLAMVDRFRVDHVYPCWAVNRWISAMLQLFWPQIRALLKERDEVIRAWAQQHPERDVFEDRELDVTSILPIDVDEQIDRIEFTLARACA